ncbi:MAG TPA: GNAT family protein [Lacipirellulaceae bacterium]|jgi:RimJ/RimL family protein N-acetyltransferase|nr:GNAT family protein [Lacipirellulaceae bacterium]
MSSAIQTDRLDLVSMTPAFLQASINGDIAEAARILPTSLPAEWPGENRPNLLIRLKQLENDPVLQPWLTRAMRLRATGAIVGLIGFHGAPGVEYPCPVAAGAAEFGFRVFPEYRRQGYAREAAVALMRWAAMQQGVTDFVLTIRPDNVASQALARGLGFVRRGFHIDEVDGEEDVLERHGAP